MNSTTHDAHTKAFFESREPHKKLHSKKTDHFQLVRLPDLDSLGNSALENTLKPYALENINKVVSSPGLVHLIMTTENI